MSTTLHHAIIVTASSEELINQCHDEAVKIFNQFEAGGNFFGQLVGYTIPSMTNDWWSFLIAPDGSGEGWTTSIDGDQARQAFLDWLGDYSIPVDYVCVEYGETRPRVLETA